MAHLDVRLAGDQEVVGSTPGQVSNILLEIDHEIFSSHSLPFTDSRAVVSFWQKTIDTTG